MSIRPIKRVLQSKPTLEGAGVKLRRAFGFGNTAEFDPFLLLDDFRNENPDDYLAGFPWHPHRGIETITYVLAVMIVAAISVHWQNGLFVMSNGIEVPLLYAAGVTALALTGPGRYSLDALLGIASVWTPALTWSVLAIGVLGGVVSLAVRRKPGQATAAS